MRRNIYFDGQDLSDLDEPAMRKIRGNSFNDVPDPMRSLNPGFSIGDQISRNLILHMMEKSEARQRSISCSILLVFLNRQTLC